MTICSSKNIFQILLLLCVCLNVFSKLNPEVDLTLEERIYKHGYPVETYAVFTEDDYILPVYHIPHGLKKSPKENKNKSTILFVHGMGGSPHNFVIFGKKQSVPYYFADRGFDVWIFSARGVISNLPKHHKTYNWNLNKEYWLFSLHEIAVYDLTATIDFVLNHTGQSKVSLIGHSAAGNEFFAMFSDRPKYNDKVKIAVTWAGSPILKRNDYPLITFVCVIANFWKGVFKFLGMTEFFPMLQGFKPMLKILCSDPDWQKVCMISTWIVGSHKSYIQRLDDTPVIISNIPRLSTRQISHFMDNYNNESFRKFDYGYRKNLRVYGQAIPPLYNLSATTVPIAFFLGPSDSIVTIEDIYTSIESIPNTVMIYTVEYPKFTHLDFVFARNSTELVYEPTYRLIKDIDNGVVFPPIKPPPKYEDYF